MGALVALGRRVRRHWAAINAALEHGLPRGLIESTNPKIRLLTRLAFGFATAGTGGLVAPTH